jgi:hypothetical protein
VAGLPQLQPCEISALKIGNDFVGDSAYRVKRGVTQIVRVERVEVQPGAQAVIGVVARE